MDNLLKSERSLHCRQQVVVPQKKENKISMKPVAEPVREAQKE